MTRRIFVALGGPIGLIGSVLCLTSVSGLAQAVTPPAGPTSTPAPGMPVSPPPSMAAGAAFIGPTDLPPALGAALQAMGGRLTTAAMAQVTLSGTITDAGGSRSAQFTIQAPGLLRYQDGNGAAVTFDGSSVHAGSGPVSAANQDVFESLLANFPDSVFLQIANGGGLRRLGSHFRTDDGKTPNYTGPYWTVYSFSPRSRKGLAAGQALQETLFIAFDEKTGLMSDVRTVTQNGAQQTVTQTEFSNWFQQNGQWFPGSIVRLANGQQTLSFQTQQASVGQALATTSFQAQ